MRIAQVAPLYESVPPKRYGGTERVVSWLTEELVSQGHEVTLFASGDSATAANLCCPVAKALRLDSNAIDYMAPHMLLLEQVFQQAEQFDIVHFHIDYLHFPLSRLAGIRQVTTLHGRLDIPQLVPLYKEFADMPLVSISNFQRRPLAWTNWQATVYHGLPPDHHKFRQTPENYLLFLGRLAPEKRVDRAIEIARATGMPLKIAGKVDPVDREYFQRDVKPLLSQPLVSYEGEVSDDEKDELVGNALAVLFPIDWPEPFGLVMIEAMACGTPIIAFRHGSVPEIIDEGVSGYVCDSLTECIEAVAKVRELDRAIIRATFEKRFSVTRMASDYLSIYSRLKAPESQQELASA